MDVPCQEAPSSVEQRRTAPCSAKQRRIYGFVQVRSKIDKTEQWNDPIELELNLSSSRQQTRIDRNKTDGCIAGLAHSICCVSDVTLSVQSHVMRARYLYI